MPLAAIAVTYLVSSISFPWVIGRMHGVDLRTVGSRKLGGSNLGKTVGVRAGILGGVLDAAKGFVAVVVTRLLGLSVEEQLACGIAAIVGQMWPVFHRFDGGRANATGWGFALAADPIAAAVMGTPIYPSLLARAFLRPRPTRLIPVVSLLSFAIFPLAVSAREGATPTALAGIVMFGLIVLRRVSAGIRADLATGAAPGRVLVNRALYDRSELQERGLVEI